MFKDKMTPTGPAVVATTPIVDPSPGVMCSFREDMSPLQSW